MIERIVMSRAHITDVEERLVLEALRSGWVAPLGPMVDRFEREVAERVGVAHALAVSSGTAALHLALLGVGAGPGTAVVVPSMTFVATANAVSYTGASPVFVDSRSDDANVDPELVIEAVRTLQNDGTHVAAVLAVDLFGRCADYGRLAPALAQMGVPLIEDAAEALGASGPGGAAGSFGAAAALSFNGNKIMTTSGGGMLLSNDPDLMARARYLSTQARQPRPWYEHTEVGFNYRMSNVLAALGVGQISRLDSMIDRRRAIRERYIDAFFDVAGVGFLGRGDPKRSDSHDNCWLTGIVLDDSVPADPELIVKTLDAHDIEARHLWKPMHLQPLHRDARMFATGAAQHLFEYGVTLPSGSELTDAQIDRVIAILRTVVAP